MRGTRRAEDMAGLFHDGETESIEAGWRRLRCDQKPDYEEHLEAEGGMYWALAIQIGCTTFDMKRLST